MRKGVIHEGYCLIYQPEHPNSCNGYIGEHRLIMETSLGRYLSSDEIIHHKDGNKQNNDIDNLQLMRRSSHITLHNNELTRYKHKVSIKLIEELYKKGLSIREIASKVNMSKSNIAYHIKKLGISKPNIQKRNEYGRFYKEVI